MISSLFDTIANSIDNVGGLLAWLFIGAALFCGLKGNNGGGSKKSGGSAS